MIPFENEKLIDFSVSTNAEKMQNALNQVLNECGRHYPLQIGDEQIMSQNLAESINPSNMQQILGYVAQADKTLVEKAMQAATVAFRTWSRKSLQERARYLFKVAAIMRRRKFEFSAWMCYEAGKTWAEADADTAEAIDFLEYYGREALRLAEPQQLTSIPGEDNEQYYIPLGVGIVIPPWNFPLAILTGMTMSAVVTGNTVLLKPAATTQIIATKFMDVLREAGIPAGVVNFVPGDPLEIGDYLTSHPQTRFISFTGSMQVGKHIYQIAAEVKPGQKWLKRVVAEMGGKDAIVVDNDADLEEAAKQIVNSAFMFAGQKCSACSRAIVHQDVYEIVANRVAQLAGELRLGPSTEQTSAVGPVIDPKAYEKVLNYIEIGKSEGKLLAGGTSADSSGFFIRPTVFGEIDPKARIAQEEIFGPVVALIRAENFEHAIDIANDTQFGLTGALFSNNRDHLEYARREFHVGNLYLNRKCTGALVGVHPFGGFNMSGTDSKAGGRDYLLLFSQAKIVTEKL